MRSILWVLCLVLSACSGMEPRRNADTREFFCPPPSPNRSVMDSRPELCERLRLMFLMDRCTTGRIWI